MTGSIDPQLHQTPGASGRPPESLPGGVVRAAGVVCWRSGSEGLEVLLVHRPRYDDWSFPKGKLEAGELLPECAVRELAEETGIEAVLGRPLPGTAYSLPTGEAKTVAYWAGRPTRAQRGTRRGTEVDDTRWVSVALARRMLSAASDHEPLEAVAAYWRLGELATAPVLVVRHATARPRDAWPRADAERPLLASGRRQALALAGLLRCWQPEQILTSPWLRCLQTLEPYAAAGGARVRTKGGLSESGFSRSPGKARKHATKLVHSRRPAAICTHRPVLSGVLQALARAARPDVAMCVPHQEPYLAPGEVLVAHVLTSSDGRIVDVERHLAPR